MNRLNNAKKVLAGLGISIVAMGTSYAAVPTEATSAITGIQTDGEALIASGWPVVAALVGGFVLFKLFKKIVSNMT